MKQVKGPPGSPNLKVGNCLKIRYSKYVSTAEQSTSLSVFYVSLFIHWVNKCPPVSTDMWTYTCPPVSIQTVFMLPLHANHACSLMHILFPACWDPSAVAALYPLHLPPSPPAYSLPRGPSMPTYLWRSHPMRGGCMVDKHQWGNFFIAIKLLRTVCRVALSVGPGLLEESNSPEREREREGAKREKVWTHRGLPVFNPNPTLQESGG